MRGIGASIFAANFHNKGIERRRDSADQKYLTTKKRYLSLLGFLMSSHARAVAFEGSVKCSTSFLQISS